MSKQLKDFRVSFMYWRFRHITTRRLRLQSWMRRKRPNTPYRPRASAQYVYRRSPRRTWIALLVMVGILTALGSLNVRLGLNPNIIWLVSLAVIVAAGYTAVRYL